MNGIEIPGSPARPPQYPSNRASSTAVDGVNPVTRNGPEPTGRRFCAGSATSRAGTMNSSVRFTGSVPIGPSVTNVTRWSPSARADFTVAHSADCADFTALVRSRQATTSRAVSGLPSWKRTPGRSSNTHVVSSARRQDVARPGASRSPSYRTSVSNTSRLTISEASSTAVPAL